MAKFILGAIITNIAGSVGGTTLKRAKNGFIMMNKTKGASKNRLLGNPRVTQLASVFSKWSYLSQINKDSWNALAQELWFPDKFGNLKNLSGRELFIKFSGQLIVAGQYNPGAYDQDGHISEQDLSGIEIFMSTSHFWIYVASITNANYLLVQAEVFTSTPTSAPIFNRRKIFVVSYIDAPGSYDFYANLITQFPNLQIGNVVRVYTTYMAINGNRGVTAYFDVLVTTSA